MQGVVTSALVFPFLPVARRGRIRQRWSAGLLRILGIELRIAGTPLIERGLLVANHVSWVDIFVVNALTPAAFVSKADVRAWPVIGWLAAVNETVFLRRGSRGHARVINDEIAERMRADRHVALFPEGTTTDGSHVLHFHAALLQPAILTEHPIQPIALRYLTPEGAFTRAAAYDGDVTMGECLTSIVGTERIVASIELLPAIDTVGAQRRQVAQAAHAAIAAKVSPEPVSENTGALAA